MPAGQKHARRPKLVRLVRAAPAAVGLGRRAEVSTVAGGYLKSAQFAVWQKLGTCAHETTMPDLLLPMSCRS